MPPGHPQAPGAGSDAFGTRRLVAAVLAAAAVLAVIILLIVLRDSGDDPPTATGGTDTTVGTTSEVTQGEGGTTGVTAPTTTAATIPPGTNLLTGDASPVIDAFAGIHGGTPPKVYSLAIYSDFAHGEFQVPGEPTHVDAYEWRDGQVSNQGPAVAVTTSDEDLPAKWFDLSEVDPTVIPGAVEQTMVECGENLELSYVGIQRDLVFDDQQRVFIDVYATNDYSDGGFFRFTLDGTFVENNCD